MPPPPINIQTRKPIWMALSAFYLDTELQDSDFQGITKVIIESPYTFDEIQAIDKYEVFPVLKYNLLQVAGEWAGFEEDWLVENIVSGLRKKSKIRKLSIEISYSLLQWMYKDYWGKLEAACIQLKN